MRQTTLFQKTKRAARFSVDREYRYTLKIEWDPAGESLNFLMLNPSTADEFANDPTVERCEQRARRMGFGSLIVTNLFAIRATDPRVMLKHHEPIGRENDRWIVETAKGCSQTILGWGNHGLHLGRSSAVVDLLRKAKIKLHALKVTGQGQPTHPLYLSYELQPFEFKL